MNNKENSKYEIGEPVDRKIDIITKLLFNIIEDNKQLPFKFEQILRQLVFEYKIDASTLRNDVGQTMLHSIAVNNRQTFALPLFRAGCWKNIYPLKVTMGKRYAYENNTADDICTILKHRKVQSEFDTFVGWEKSLNAIHISARRGDAAEVKRFLEFSQDLHNELDDMECTTLYWAVIGGNLEVVKILLDLNVDYKKINSRKETLLHACCMVGHINLIEILVTKLNINLVVKDSAKKSALLRVAENGDDRCLAKLMECGMRKNLLGPILAIAGHYGRINFIKYIVENYDIDPQSKDEAGKSAYLRASEEGQMDVLRFMFSKQLDWKETDCRGRNVLHMAADGAQSDIMLYLITELKKRNVPVKDMINTRDRYIGGELCMLIRGKDKGRDSWHYVEVIRGLFDIFMKKTLGGTIDVAKYGTLLNSGWGNDPDESAAREIERRFETRRNATSVEDIDATPLHIAAFKDKLDVAKVLIENSADVNIHDKFGLSPLHIAAIRGNMELVQFLLKNGANYNKLDSLIKTPADIAEDNEHYRIANYLKNINTISIIDNFRNTLMPIALQPLSNEDIKIIHEEGKDLKQYTIDTLREITIMINKNSNISKFWSCFRRNHS